MDKSDRWCCLFGTYGIKYGCVLVLESYFKLILRGLVMEYYETPKFDHGKSTSLLFNFPFQR